jgi:hypothetical protein
MNANLFKKITAIALAAKFISIASAQTLNQKSLEIATTFFPYAFGANIDVSFFKLWSVSSADIWGIPASYTSFTPTKKGSSSTPIYSYLKKYYSFNKYYTRDQSVTAIDEATANGPYSFYGLSSGLTLANTQQINGNKGGVSFWTYSGTAGALITLNGSMSGVENLFASQTGSPSSTIGIDTGKGGGEQKLIRDVVLLGPFTTGVNKSSGAVHYLSNVNVKNSGPTGIYWSNPSSPDTGDDNWHGITVSGPTVNLVEYVSSGGLKVSGFKGLGGTNGFHLNVADSAITQDFLFTGSSIENSTKNCMLLERSGTNGLFGGIVIVGNEFAGCPSGITFNNGGVGNAVVQGNTFATISGPAIKINQGAFNVNVGINSYQNLIPIQDNRNIPPYSDETGLVLWRFKRAYTGILARPKYMYKIDMPSFRGATCTAVFEGIVQGSGSFIRQETFSLVSGAPNTNIKIASVAGMSFSAGSAVNFETDITTTPGSIYVGLSRAVGSQIQGTLDIDCRGKIKQITYN